MSGEQEDHNRCFAEGQEGHHVVTAIEIVKADLHALLWNHSSRTWPDERVVVVAMSPSGLPYLTMRVADEWHRVTADGKIERECISEPYRWCHRPEFPEQI